MAAVTFAVMLEGVLAGRNDDINLAQAMLDPIGGALYGSLAQAGRLVLISKLERRLVEHWLRSNGLVRHAALYPAHPESNVRKLRAAGETPDLYVDWSPTRCAQSVKDGVNTMLYARPLYARSGFQRSELPGLQRPFAAVMAEQGRQEEARARPSFDDDEDAE